MKNVLEHYKEQTGMTYQQIVDMCGLPAISTICQHCHGKRKITAEMDVRYNRALGIPLSELRPDLWPEKGEKADE